MAEDQSEPGLDEANKPPPENVAKQLAALEAEKKEFEEVSKAMDEIAKFVDQFNEKDGTKVEQKAGDSKESPVEDDPESNQSIRLVLEDSEESRDLKTDDKERVEDKREGVGKENSTIANDSKPDEKEAPTPANGDESSQKEDEVEKSEVGSGGKVDEKPSDKQNGESSSSEPLTTSKGKNEDKPPLEKIIIRLNKKSENDTAVVSATIKNPEAAKKSVVRQSSAKEEGPAEESALGQEKEKPTEAKEEILAEPEVGIVGPPAAASEVLSEAELAAAEKPSLPTDDTKSAAVVSDRVAQWVENSATEIDDPVPVPLPVDLEAAARNDETTEETTEETTDDTDDTDEADETDEAGNKTRGRKRKQEGDGNAASVEGPSVPRKAQKVVSSIIRRSIRCLNKMHAMDASSGGGNGKKSSAGDLQSTDSKFEDEEDSRKSPKVPQSQQNGAALPEETASSDRGSVTLRIPTSPLKREKEQFLATDGTDITSQDSQVTLTKSSRLQISPMMNRPNRGTGQRGRPSLQSQMLQRAEQQQQQQQQQTAGRETRKRRSAELLSSHSSNGSPSCSPKKLCSDQREQFISSLVGTEKFTAEQLATKAEQLRAEVQDLDELARAKEMEWNEILSMRKLKEEAFLRIERRRQILGYMESNGPLSASESHLLPPASLALAQSNCESKDKALLVPKEEQVLSRDSSPGLRRERAPKTPTSFHQHIVAKQQQQQQQQLIVENGPRQLLDPMSPEHRQIGEGRQGPIVDVRSIIADYRLRHPETVPRRRGRRMRNSINVGLGAGGAMVETIGHMDSRPSSADSCKSGSNVNDPNNAMSFKDVLVQFAKLSQQQGEPIKTPQNYPDVTLHPVAPSQATQNSAPQTSSLLHGILTKSQSPRPTNFSPTLARLLTAPERERNAPTIISNPHPNTQHLLQAYQSSNSVSISDFLSSSKARTEITITPVVNNQQSHSSNLIQIDDQDDDTSIIEERDSRLSMGPRDNREDKDPPRCQGCNERSAQFVCAGCGNQWYCSRECQVAAWDDHSDNCSG